MTYTFHLRPGLTFTDGSSLNATTVKRAIQRVITMNLPGSSEFLLEQVAQLGKTPTIDTPNCPGTCTTIVFHLLQPVGLLNHPEPAIRSAEEHKLLQSRALLSIRYSNNSNPKQDHHQQIQRLFIFET